PNTTQPSAQPPIGSNPAAGSPSSTQPVQATQPKPGAPANSSPTGAPSSGQPASAEQKQTGAQQASPTVPPASPAQPKTEILDSSATSGALPTDGHDPILDPAPVPQTTTTLVGGTITSVDRMRNRMTVHVFNGGHWNVNFDERTHIFRNGAETTQLALKKGERVYVDTQLDNNRHDIFARNVRVGVASLPADADGQIINVDPKHSELTLRDTINSVPVRFAVNQDTRISSGQTPAVFKDVRPGALVHVRFAAESPNRGLAREINILAAPGSAFTFAGKITYLDLHRGMLALQNASDDKNYQIRFAPLQSEERNRLSVGTDVRIIATFEGSQYTAQSINVMHPSSAGEKKED
ncbi:MAG TPA: DUF5666 domain-containing protein, partial [Candidatus Sulfotelmatobacter sp.]|nr:DUF5666 domain-containing protein [Candidatus Sulfotelmatobacter sp.]